MGTYYYTIWLNAVKFNPNSLNLSQLVLREKKLSC